MQVTIIPPLHPGDYLRMLADPTAETAVRYLQVGQRECWRKLPMLATRLRIAHALQALQASLEAPQPAARHKPAAQVQGRGAVGIKRSDSTLHF